MRHLPLFVGIFLRMRGWGELCFPGGSLILPWIKILEALKRIEPDLPVIVVSAWTDKGVRDQATLLGAAAFFAKPVKDWAKLHRKIIELIARREAARAGQSSQTIRLEGVQPEIMAKSRRLNKLREQAAVMGFRTPPEVLIEIEDLERELWNIEHGGGLPGWSGRL